MTEIRRNSSIAWDAILTDIDPTKKPDANLIQARLTTFMSIVKQGVLTTISDENADIFHKRLREYFSILIQEAPTHNGLLNTKTYRSPDSPGNPRFLEMIQAFGMKREGEIKHYSRYISWLKQQLLISQEQSLSDIFIEEEATKECQFSLQIIKRIEDKLGNEGGGLAVIQKSNSRSPAFDVIHGDSMNIPKLLHLCFSYFIEYHKAKKILEKINDTNSPEYKRQKRVMSDRNKSMFEIARIFAVMDIQLRIKQAHGKGTQDSDKIFLVNKMLELIEGAEPMTNEVIFKNDNPFFQVTSTETIWWNAHKGEYKISLEDDHEEEDEEGNEVKLEGCKITGISDYFGKKQTVNIRHIDFRGEKSLESSILKALRKNLESPHEILDHRGFRFVVDTKEEALKLCSILAHELGSGPNSWKTIPIWESNRNSGSNFQCLKGNIAIGYKSLQAKNIKKTIKNALPDNQQIEYLISDQGYQLETEIQIFVGLDSYISAHHDPKSPAYHKNYKNEQLLEMALKFYPPSIYPKTHRELTRILATKKALKYLIETRISFPTNT